MPLGFHRVFLLKLFVQATALLVYANLCLLCFVTWHSMTLEGAVEEAEGKGFRHGAIQGLLCPPDQSSCLVGSSKAMPACQKPLPSASCTAPSASCTTLRPALQLASTALPSKQQGSA